MDRYNITAIKSSNATKKHHDLSHVSVLQDFTHTRTAAIHPRESLLIKNQRKRMYPEGEKKTPAANAQTQAHLISVITPVLFCRIPGTSVGRPDLILTDSVHCTAATAIRHTHTPTHEANLARQVIGYVRSRPLSRARSISLTRGWKRGWIQVLFQGTRFLMTRTNGIFIGEQKKKKSFRRKLLRPPSKLLSFKNARD